MAFNETRRQEEATVQLGAVRGNRVDLLGGIASNSVAVRNPAGRVAANVYNALAANGPLALHSEEAFPEVEDEVEAPSFDDRPVDVDAELHRSMADRGFGNRALLVGRHDTNISSPAGHRRFHQWINGGLSLMPEKTDYGPVTERAPEAEVKRERRAWSTVFWSVHALWIYALVLAGIIVLVIYLTGGFGEGARTGSQLRRRRRLPPRARRPRAPRAGSTREPQG